MPGRVITFDPKGAITYADERLESFLGVPANTLVGKTLEDLTIYDWRHIAHAHAREAQRGTSSTFDARFFNANREVWARVTITPVHERDVLVGTIAILIDITSERLVESKLREAELRLREAAVHMPGVIYELRCDAQGIIRVEYVSEGVHSYTGKTAEEIMSDDADLSQYLHPDDAVDLAVSVATALKTRRPTSLEFRLLFDDAIYHMYTVASITPLAGDVYAINGVAIDIGDRKHAEAQLRSSQAQLRAVFDNFPFECWTVNPSGAFVLQNALSQKRWGNLHNQTIMEIEQPDDVVFDWVLDTRAALRGEVVRRELVLGDPGNAPTHLVRLSVPIRDEDEVLGVLGISIDTTEQRRLEEQLLQSQKLDAIGRLAGGIAHDFNNVLTAIMSCVRLLERRLEGPPRKELQLIREGAKRAAELTRQLLAFAKQEMVKPCTTPFDDIILKADRLLRRLIGEDIELVTLTNAADSSVSVDPIRFEQAIINLVVNARDALPNGGKITLVSEAVELTESIPCIDGRIPPGSYVLMRVTDTGIGMTSETIDRAFEPFFTTRQESGGTGLGLSSVYGSLRQAGGYVTLESELAVGTSVTLYLPRIVAEEKPLEVPVEPPVKQRSTGGSETILLVEDEPLVMIVASQSLKLGGYTVLKASSAQEALAISRSYEGDIDLLLTDVVMPLGSGPDLARTLVTERPDMAVVFMSGYISARIDMELEDVFFLPKPFTPEALDAQVREALDSPR